MSVSHQTTPIRQLIWSGLLVSTILLLAGFITSCRRQDYPTSSPSSGGESSVGRPSAPAAPMAMPSPALLPEKDRDSSEPEPVAPSLIIPSLTPTAPIPQPTVSSSPSSNNSSGEGSVGAIYSRRSAAGGPR